jgi:thiol-disulfide isomerase/thioredoxin
MIRKLSIAAASVVLLIAVGFAGMYLMNPAPIVPSAQPGTGRPVVVKFHARWCVLCMATKDVWEELHAAYANRVDLVVFDFTSDETTAAARAEAQRLGLERLFDEYFGTTGSVFVLDGRSRNVRNELHGDRNFGEYRTAIDAALRDAGR